MKKILTMLSLTLLIGIAGSLSANKFPKCEAACKKYYNCVVSSNPNATDEQKNLLQKGCNLNCNKAKYYPSISKCYDKSQGSCKSYWNCITKAMQK